MLEKNKLNRIKELSKKNKEQTITEQEQQERKQLHKEYLASFRKNMTHVIEHTTVIDHEGNDVTPQKVKDTRAKNKKGTVEQ